MRASPYKSLALSRTHKSWSVSIKMFIYFLYHLLKKISKNTEARTEHFDVKKIHLIEFIEKYANERAGARRRICYNQITDIFVGVSQIN